jgi:hypothetical protein
VAGAGSASTARAPAAGSPNASAYGTTTTRRSEGSRPATSASFAARPWTRPPCRYASPATSTAGAICPKRSTTPAAPKSGEHDDHTAPRLDAASIATTASGALGR